MKIQANLFFVIVVASRNANIVVNIATEMIETYRQKKPLPILLEMDHRDDVNTRRIKRIIKHMTEFRSMERKNIQEVEEEYKGNLLIV